MINYISLSFGHISRRIDIIVGNYSLVITSSKYRFRSSKAGPCAALLIHIDYALCLLRAACACGYFWLNRKQRPHGQVRSCANSKPENQREFLSAILSSASSTLYLFINQPGMPTRPKSNVSQQWYWLPIAIILIVGFGLKQTRIPF